MSSVRPAYDRWPRYNQRLREVVAGMTPSELAISPGPDRWPIWATVGHLACQRVFWLCDFAGEPGADTTPFADAANYCPGDDDLENVLDPVDLLEAIDSSFAIVERALDTWALESLDEEIRREEWGAEWAQTRSSVLQRLFGHDLYHCGELSQTLGIAGLSQIDPWG